MTTIGDIIEDVNPFTEKGAKIVTVPVIPRKIVEDIIAECEHDISVYSALMERGNLTERKQQRVYAKIEYAYQLMHFAQSKLLEFEGVSE